MRRIYLLIGVVLLGILTFVRLWDPAPVTGLRLGYFDFLQRMAPREKTELPVKIVDIDEASLAAFGQWPWPRDLLAELTDRLAAFQASVVVYDILFAEPDRYSPGRLLSETELSQLGVSPTAVERLGAIDHDRIFAQSLEQLTVVLGTAYRTGPADDFELPKTEALTFADDAGAPLPDLNSSTPVVPVLRDAALGVGVVSVSPGSGASVVRQLPLAWETPDGILPTLSIEALRVAFGEPEIVLWTSETEPPVVEAIGLGRIDVPTGPDGQFWLRYREEDPTEYISAAAVLQNDNPARLTSELQGAIVFVGTSAPGLLDIRTSALGQAIPGVSIHAQVVEQILSGDYLVRADWVEGLEILTMLAIGMIVTAVMSISGPVLSMFFGAASGGIIAAVSWYAFTRNGVLFDATFPLVGGFLAFATVAAYQFVVADRDKRMIRRSFSQYVAPSVLDQIESSGYRLELGGTIQDVTVLFCDIRDFTTLSERITAAELVELLNRHFDTLGAEILAEEGTIDKYIGDSVMAFWNAPVLVADHAARACRAAIGMRRALQEAGPGPDGSIIRIATGVNTGSACVGNIGSRERFNYSVVGDVVNVASRVEGACRRVGYDVLASSDTVAEAPGLAFLRAGWATLKGKTDMTEIHAVVGDEATAASEEFGRLSAAHEILLAALVDGAPEAEVAQCLDRCRILAADVDPNLAGFYDLIPGRRDDFVSRAREAAAE